MTLSYGLDFRHRGVGMVRTIQCIAGIAFWVAFTSIAMGQQRGGPDTSQVLQQIPASSTAMRSYLFGNTAPSRRVQARTESAGREVITETTEVPGTDGLFKTLIESITETVGTGSVSVHTKRDVFGTDADGRAKLIQTTQADQETLPDGTSRTMENTWTADLDGHLGLSQRQLQETKAVGPNVKETNVTIYRPGINEALREAERVQQAERKVSPDLLQNEITRFVLDSNGRWQAIETRNREVRTTGSTESIEEETVQRPDANSALKSAERKVTRQSMVNGQNQILTEIYSQAISGSVGGLDSQLELNERLRITTVTTPDGGRQTIQEVERRNLAAPNDPLRVIERTVETVRPIGLDRWETQRQVFALDGNARLVLAVAEIGDAAAQR